MELPLISHPQPDDVHRRHPNSQTTDAGHLRLTAHCTVVPERATTLFTGPSKHEQTLWVAATLHDFGKATPQFQKHVRPKEDYEGPTEEKNHARLGALATWFVLDRLGSSDRDCLAAMLAVARHHQALPNATSYTTSILVDAFDDETIRAQLKRIDETWPEAADELLQMAIRDEHAVDISWRSFYQWAMAGSIVDDLHQLSSEPGLVKPRPAPEKLPSKLYDRTLHYWASLTLADKSHAMTIPDDELFGLQTLDAETLEEYIAQLRADPPADERESTLNDERERARRQAVCGVHEWLINEESSIATLTLPTGLGKTFTGLSAGFEARDLLDAEHDRGHPRPIVYALPYTSIIEQTRELFEKPELWGADPTKSALTVHHYLSETVVVHDDHDESDVDTTDDEDQAGLLGESWRDGTILTTFVQLFESLTGPSNRQGLKLPALDSGIVILDEPQALPKAWWDAIPRLLDILTGEFGAHIISMTATQPSVFRELDTVSLLSGGQTHDAASCDACMQRPAYETDLPPVAETNYFDQAERVRYTLDQTALVHQIDTEKTFIGYEMAADRILNTTEVGESTLAVCNTIASSAELTKKIVESGLVTHLGERIENYLTDNNISGLESKLTPKAIANEILAEEGLIPPVDGEGSWSTPPDSPVYLLTFNSRYRPFDRRILITILTTLSTAPVRFICVSTQAIEAGVDVSFKTVFRDIAPVDSIVQAAGRCNRSYEWGTNGGRVIVWTLADPDEETPTTPTETPPAEYVYDRGTDDVGIPTHLRLISRVLAGIGKTEDIPDGELSRHAVDAYFQSLSSDHSVASTEIREHIEISDAQWLSSQSLIGGYETVDVLVAVTDSDVSTLEEITEAFDINDRFGFKKLNEATQLRVSLPVRTMDDAPMIPRIDHRDRGEDGAQVFEYIDGGGLTYELAIAGLRGEEDSILGRFTTV